MFLYLLKWVLEIAVPPAPRLDEIFIPRDEMGYIDWLIERVSSIPIEEPTFHDYGTSMSVYTTDFEDLFFHMDIAIRYLVPHSDSKDIVYPKDILSVTYVEYRLNVKRGYTDTRHLLTVLVDKYRLFKNKLSELDESEMIYQKRRWARMVQDITTVLETFLLRNDRNESEFTDTF